MAGQTAIEAATERLNRALDLLEAAVDRRIEIEKSRTILTEQVHALDADRARLAADLDAQTARARRLEAANRDIAKRIDAAMDNVRGVLDARER
jgi:chromosome segregation ATPase